jgi:adenylosuccinate lyase
MAVIPAMENVALWHERDISHSSVERMIGPDATVTLDFALHRLAGVIEKLVIYPDNMIANMNKFRGLVHSQRVLLALTQAGVSREDAYRLVQRNAMKVWEEGKDFREELLADEEVTAALSGRRSRRNSTSATTPSMWTRSSPGSSARSFFFGGRISAALAPDLPRR